MSLKLPSINDIGPLMKVMRKFHRTTQYKDVSFDYEKTIATLTAIISGDKNESILIVSEEGGEITGFIAGMIISPLFSKERIASELAWWVDPDKPNLNHGRLLASAYEDWAKRVGAKKVSMGYLDNERRGVLDKMFKKKGYMKTETTFIKGLL